MSGALKHDLAIKVPLILFASSSEFWQQNVIPGAATTGDLDISLVFHCNGSNV